MAYNNLEMNMRHVSSVCKALLIAAATLSCSMELGPYGENVRSPVEGTLYIDLPETVPYDFQESGLLGTVQIIIGKHVHTVYPSIISYDYIYHRLEIPLSVTVNFDGVAVITCVSRLSYAIPATEEEGDETGDEPDEEETGEPGTEIPEEPGDPADEDPYEPIGEEDPSTEEPDAEAVAIEYAGYLITSLTKDRTNWINDTDHDGFVSIFEEETMPLLQAMRYYADYTETEPVQAETVPNVERFDSLPQSSTPDLSTTISGSVSSLEWALVYVRINHQYQWIETVQDPYQPDRASIPELIADPILVSLKPGINEIELIAVNSHGVSFSDIITVVCTAQLHEDMENILVTLTWDTVADLDLHTWYYSPEEEEFIWHNSYFQPDTPDTDTIKNLDADNRTGFGPEHFTLLGAPDGYYIIAVNAHSLAGLPAVNAFVSIETNERLHSLGPFRITEESEDVYPVNGNPSWARIADIRITEGVAEICDPDLNLDPPNLIVSTLPSVAQALSIKRALKTR